ncbi:alpha/beta hydrolase [Ideonella sp. DXS29W]|uniref:Alpha/beta hydrolase n=1 Tax=Ideonella lacteola TaxID=2984193 RepID=A0ABU9BPL6_9BURK
MKRIPSVPPRRRGGWQSWLAALLGGAGAAAPSTAAEGPPVAPAPSPGARPASAPSDTAVATPAAAPAVAPSALSRAGMVVYKTADGSKLKMHFARPDPQKFPGPRPCVVFFHGGAWRSGDPKQFMAYAEKLAEVGVIGVSAQYRLLQDGDVLPMNAVRDARSALRYLRSKGAQLGCDVQRIGAGGGSSGGHLAAMAAVSISPPAVAGKPAAPNALDDPSDDPSVSPRPQALFLMNPPLNLERFERPVPAEQRRQLSPTLLMDASLPPTWIFHGTADKVVPFSQVTEFRDRARSLGAGEVTVQAFPGRGHGFFNAKRGDGGDFDATVTGIYNGLKKLGWIDAKP